MVIRKNRNNKEILYLYRKVRLPAKSRAGEKQVYGRIFLPSEFIGKRVRVSWIRKQRKKFSKTKKIS